LVQPAGLAASLGAILGSLSGTASWMIYTHIKIGKITAANLSSNYALLTGSVVSLGLSVVICVVVSFIRPDKEQFQWESFTKVAVTPCVPVWRTESVGLWTFSTHQANIH
jgi:hypothetical protein